MQEYIGEEVNFVINILKSKGIKYIIQENNFNIEGDVQLVTNIYTQDDIVVITTGSFIFDVRNKNNEE